MHNKTAKKALCAAIGAGLIALTTAFATACGQNAATPEQQKPSSPTTPDKPAVETPITPAPPKPIFWNKVAGFDSKFSSPDGGVAEIVQYNTDNNRLYLVNGKSKTIDIITLAKYGDANELQTSFDEATARIDFNAFVSDHATDFAPGFVVGDITSVAINTELDVVAVAVQHEDFTKPGAIVLLDYDGGYKKAYACGIEPDCITFAGKIALTADEGEPRSGYANGVDPKGSVTILDLGAQSPAPTIVTFDDFDAKRDELVANKVILKKGAMPSVDLEPEYIAVSGNTAYVSLQEANAIATLDIQTKKFTQIKGLGFKDHGLAGNEIDIVDDGKADIKLQPDFYGVRMPDGIDTFTAGDKTYIVTANEGDAREWGTYSDIEKFTIEGTKVDVLINSEFDGLEAGKHYLLGGRSFSIFNASDMSLVYDSGDKIERIISESDEYKAYFNCNSTATTIDGRSKKKGPEPEMIKVETIDGKRYVFVVLERQGGAMMFDITDLNKIEYKSFANSRDYTQPMAGDVAPEGIDFVPAAQSLNGKNLLMLANENSGTVSIYAMENEKKTYTMHATFTDAPQQSPPTENPETKANAELLIYSVFGNGGKTDGQSSHDFIAIYNNTATAIDLGAYKIRYCKNPKANDAQWSEKTLVGSLPSHKYYVVRCKEANTRTVADNKVSAPRIVIRQDSDYNLDWAELEIDNKQYTIQIAKTADGAVVDMLGVKDAADDVLFEGAAATGISKQKIIIRKSATGTDNPIDTDDNSSDFAIVAIDKLSSDEAAEPYKPTAYKPTAVA